MAKQIKPSDPTIYLENNTSGWISKHDLIGQTSRSWHLGNPRRPFKMSKSEYVAVMESDYLERLWMKSSAYHIGNLVQCVKDPAIMRQIAKLVGYVKGA